MFRVTGEKIYKRPTVRIPFSPFLLLLLESEEFIGGDNIGEKIARN